MTTLATVENLALELPEHQRATLAMHILDSLPGLFSEPLLVISAEEAGETGHCARAVAGVLPLLV